VIRIVVVASAILLGLVTLLAGSALGYRAWRQHENAAKLAIQSGKGIAEGRFIKVGGIDQWVEIRGEDAANPVLLILHGGPGSSYVPAAAIFRNWEKYFTVVQWDQRGTGRTFGRNGAQQRELMTVERMVQDGIEVLEYLRKRFDQPRILLLGTSWGTILGTHIAQQRPDLLAAYVGSGQVVDMARSETLGYESLLRKVRAAGDQQAIDALTTIGPPPYQDVDELGVQRERLDSYRSPAEREFLRKTLFIVLFAPNYSLRDVLDYDASSAFSVAVFFKDIVSTDLTKLRTFEVPMYFVQGDADAQTPTPLVEEYVASLQAPVKQLTIVPDAGHFVALASPDRLLMELRRIRGEVLVSAQAVTASH